METIKIGILTYHCAYNPGAMLQCYALQEFLKSKKFYVEVIDYRPRYMNPTLKFQKWRIRENIIKGLHYTFVEYPFTKRHFTKYREFEDKYFNKSRTIYSSNELIELAQSYDYIIIGSDQVWQSKYNGQDHIWYGEGLTTLPKTKILTYGASSGKYNFQKWEYELFQLYLSEFTKISVREDKLKLILSKLTTNDITVVLDPVLMINPIVWRQFYTKIKLKTKYIVIYQGRKSDNIFSLATKIANHIGNNCQIVSVDLYNNSYRSGVHHIAVSPMEFIFYIKKAEYVLTTSFHGTICSIIQNTPFYYLSLNDNDNERVENILSKLGLVNRIIDKEFNGLPEKIDYQYCNKIIDNLRHKSQKFLTDSIIQK